MLHIFYKIKNRFLIFVLVAADDKQILCIGVLRKENWMLIQNLHKVKCNVAKKLTKRFSLHDTSCMV